MEFLNAWLNYHKTDHKEYMQFLKEVNYGTEDAICKQAMNEIILAIKNMFQVDISCRKLEEEQLCVAKGIVLQIVNQKELGKEGYHMSLKKEAIIIEANTSVGILYGTFGMLRKFQLEVPITDFEELKVPSNPLRMLNHWDNMDGSIERGYSGKSFFFKEEGVIVNSRTVAYARLMASVGINGVVINNVNVRGNATFLITKRYISKLKEMGEIFSSYGIKLFLSINFAAPIELGGLTTSDPLDEGVRNWWQEAVKLVFEEIPSFGGFLVKADSEGRPGPFTYGRTHAEGANMLAEAVEPYGGLIIWRCFVYNCMQDWRDRKTDRARAGYDNFKSLDGDFLDNVILQIKNGPMDFQVREPVSPLFGGLKTTNQMLEVQIAQEYTGQQIHACYLIPMFKEILDFRTFCESSKDKVEDIISGRTYHQKNCGMAAVANTGDDENWTGHDLAASNLYGFGRLSFDTSLSSTDIAREWISLTFQQTPEVLEGIEKILMISWPAYEKYTSPLGIGWMVNPSHHYGPNVDGYEYDRWGTYHRADHFGLGVDRSRKGTGYSQQYQKENAELYDNIETCPEKLLLFFHYVNYTYKLSSGRTLIQHIYDTHFEGVEEVEIIIEEWKKLKGRIDKDAYERVLFRMEKQLSSAKDWRDIVCSYFYRKSSISDEKNRKIY